MAHVSEGKETEDFKAPNSVEKVAIEKGSNPAKLASQYTPKEQIIYEYAVKAMLRHKCPRSLINWTPFWTVSEL